MIDSKALGASLVRVLWWKGLALLAVLLLGGVVWGVGVLNKERETVHRHQIERELVAISSLQADSLSAWRGKRLTDAATLMDDTLLAEAVADWFHTPTDTVEGQLLERLRTLQERARYTAVYLVDPMGQLRLAGTGSASGLLPAPEMQALQTAIADAVVGVVEPRRDAFFAFPFFSFVAPVFDGAQAAGAVWLVSDVRTSLYPLLTSWPTPSESAEAAIVTRSGDDALFLSPLRHRPGAEMDFRIPLTQPEDPAVQAVQGLRGMWYGVDYRGQKVVSVVRSVPNSPWFTVTKVDEAEVFADVRMRELLSLALALCVGLIFAGFGFGYWQHLAWGREQALKTELQRNMRWLEGAQKTAYVGYFSFDVARDVFTTSSMTNTIFGFRDADRPRALRDWMALLHPEDSQRILALHRQSLAARGTLRTEYRIIRKMDAQVRWIETWGECELEAERVVRLIGTVQDITVRKESEQKLASYRDALEKMVRQDSLTGVANRRALDECVATEWQRARRCGSPLSLLMVDVDHFKAFNDRHGHLAGDRCLQQVAQAIASSVQRAGELVARYGGEEFAVLLPDADAAHALAVAERVCAAVRQLQIPHSGAGVALVTVSVSVGVATVQPTWDPASPQGATPESLPTRDAQAVQALFQRADAALYHAKQSGRDRVQEGVGA